MKTDLLLLSLLTVTVVEVKGQCTEVNVRLCMDDWPGATDAMHSVRHKRQSQDNILREGCAKLKDKTECMAALDCTESDRPAVYWWHGFRDSLNWLCLNPEAREVNANDSCLQSPIWWTEMLLCNGDYVRVLLSNSNGTCDAANDYLDCSEEILKDCRCNCSRLATWGFMKFAYLQVRPPTTLEPLCVLKVPDIISAAHRQTTSTLILLLSVASLCSFILKTFDKLNNI